MRAALFDIDGTLVTFKFDVQGTRQALIEELARSGLDTGGLGLSTPTQTIMDAAKKRAVSGRTRIDFSALRKRLYSILDDFEVESSREATVFPRTRETLLYLRTRSVRLAILTNSGKKAAYSVLRRGRIIDLFDFVLTREDVDTMKPSPNGILQALARLSLPKDDVCYVGDGILDIVAAKGAGLKVVSVATGIYDANRLRKEGADFVISSLSELPNVFGV